VPEAETALVPSSASAIACDEMPSIASRALS
jgi:hypothetical protein